MNKYKINKMNGVLKMNNENYIPFQLHQLPKKYNEISLNDIIKMKGFIYIKENNFKNSKNIIDTLSHNKDLNYIQKR